MSNKAIAFIHARGGSKRIPRKNIKDFFGKPAISYPIEAAIKSGVFDHVIISTDDAEIAETAVKYGAECHYMRPAELANDTATTDMAFIHDVKTMRDVGFDFDYACCIYGTSVFLEPYYLQGGFETISARDDIGTVMSVMEYDFPIFRALVEDETGILKMREPQYRSSLSQDLPDAYHDAAQFYFVNVDNYMTEGKLYSEKGICPTKIPHSKVVDIDTPDDWIRAEMTYQALVKTQQ
jgi:pseudaminic acid cytidylyltransferase